MCEQIFTIKRGMVFFLETPSTTSPIPPTSETIYQKKRPYIVISSNKCNEFSKLIHVAPIISRDYDPKRWFCVPFKACGNKNEVVDITQLMLIDKAICTKDAYSETFSRDTINNETLFEGLKFAIMKQLGFFEDPTHLVYKTENATVASATPINLVINLNGVPVNNVTTETKEKQTAVNIDYGTVDKKPNIIENNDGTRRVAAVTDEEIKLARGIPLEAKTETPDSNDDKSKDNDYKKPHRTKLSYETENRIERYVRRYSKKFNGNMSASELAEICNCSVYAINKTIERMLNKQSTTLRKCMRVNLPKCMDDEFLADYEKYGTEYCLEKYAPYGFRAKSQVWSTVASRRKANREKEKELEKVT